MSQRDKYLAVAVFTGVATLLYADQNLMAPNLTAIAKDLNIPDVSLVVLHSMYKLLTIYIYIYIHTYMHAMFIFTYEQTYIHV